MRKFFVIVGTTITFGLFSSCTAEVKDRIKGHWISHETFLTSGTKKKIDSLRIIEFNRDGTYFTVEKGKEFLGRWTLTKKNTDDDQRDLLTVIVNNQSIVYEVLEIKADELVLLELTNREEMDIRIPFKRVKM